MKTPVKATLIAVAVAVVLVLAAIVYAFVDQSPAPPGFEVGRVTDFLAYGNLSIGNLADIALVAGVILVGLILWIRRRYVGVVEKDAAASPGTVAPTGSAVSGS
ncbi:hypothetical protein RYJ27_00920 [Microbacterium limosum]|uniref:Uncharacterized protein n=1 Tax=Microbacterium limosum TaxID=3079935 RepID=A0AAU0MI42_9MICO|nr:hypothetical protein [Microbacterium sp. Y20]WOQ69840.1 hypothetical protein RYJ27_00920 [Microbacterium sp. Y20]